MKQNLRGTLLFTATEASKGLNPKRVDSRYRKISCFTIIFPHISKGTVPPGVYIPTCFPFIVGKSPAKSPTKSTNKKSLVKKKRKNRPIKSLPKQKKRRSMKVPLALTHLHLSLTVKAVADLVQFAQDGDQNHQQHCSHDQLPGDLHEKEAWGPCAYHSYIS